MKLRLIPELVDDVLSGQKTSSIRAGNVRQIREGPALFRVPGRWRKIPIEIDSVRFEQRLDLLPDSDLWAQGPFVREILEREGRGAAIAAILEGMQKYYPGYEIDQDVTVVHFRVRGRRPDL